MSAPDDLTDLLKSWQHEPPAAPAFAREVRARLARAGSADRQPADDLRRAVKPPLWFSLRNLFGQAFPLAASLLLLLSIAAGSGLAVAYTKATHETRMAEAYAQTIDPLKMMAHR